VAIDVRVVARFAATGHLHPAFTVASNVPHLHG